MDDQEERDVLVFGDRRWITNLHYSFQDNTNLVSISASFVQPPQLQGSTGRTLIFKFALPDI